MATTSYQSTYGMNLGSGDGFIGTSWTTIGKFIPDQNCQLTQVAFVGMSANNNTSTSCFYSIRITDANHTQLWSPGLEPSTDTTNVVYAFGLALNVSAGSQYYIEIETDPTNFGSGYSSIAVAYTAPASTSGNTNGINWNNTTDNAWEVSVTWNIPNNPPNAPSFFNISSSGSTIDGTPKFFVNVSDPDSGNTITNVEFQTANDSGFTNNVWDDQYGNDSGYGGTNASFFTGVPSPNNSANPVSYHWGASRSAGTYYIRARCKDNNGAWSAWSAVQAFTIAAAPWSDTPVAGDPGLKAQWMNDLATVINNSRIFRGKSSIAMLDGTLDVTKDMKYRHISERRKLLQDILSLVSVTPTWTLAALTNLLTADQATAGDVTSGTSGFGSYAPNGSNPIARDTTTYLSGAGSIKVTNTYTAAQTCSINTSPTKAPVTAGQSYTAEGYVKCTAGSTLYLELWWVNSSGGTISGNQTQNITLSGGWDKIILENVVAPAGAVSAFVEIYFNNLAVNGSAWMDNPFLANGDPTTADRDGQHIIELRNYCTQV